ncbi:tyrosine-type recombinase/integrase [Cerasicoccus frondis]|uniref:tyrosine-type recombinase/integrase n=1 Tax=Cerasicoccus frondis TaxID=490090 RepID=UPI0028529F58|nr:tyrosine-type recombinase/integrase [Cerasicoccus frondis]
MIDKARAGELTQASIFKSWGELLERTTGEPLDVATIEDYLREYLKSKEATGTAESTLKRYRPVINGFLDSLPPRRLKASLGSVTAREIEQYRDSEKAAGKSASTCDFTLKVLSSVFSSAHRKGLILSNPALAVDALRGEAEEREPFTIEQVKALLRVADTEWRGMILLGLHAGLRLADASALTWANVDRQAGIITYREQKTAGRKRTGKRETTVVLHQDILNYLDGLPPTIGSTPLFPSLVDKATGSSGGLSNTFNQLMKAAKIAVPRGRKATGKGRTFRKLGFHSLRHSMISNLANANISADVRQTMVGHSSDEIHRRYTHLDLSTQRDAVAKLESVL